MTCPDCEKYILQGKRFCGTCGRDFASHKCPDCEKYRQAGDRYCGTCGAILTDDREVTNLICPDCDRYRAEGRKYCGTCGGYLIPDGRPRYRDDFRLLKPCVIIGALLVILEIVLAWVSLPYVFTTEGLKIELIYITPIPEHLVTFTGIPMMLWYLALCIVLTLCMITCAKRYVEAKSRREDPVNTSLVSVPLLLGMSLLIEYIFIFASMVNGSVDIDPDLFDKTIIPELVNASVWEELVSRVALIGLPMMVIMLIASKGHSDLPWYRYLAGGFGYSRVALILVVFSSVFFGCAHLNWGLWKILPTIIGGLAMGYVYMRYGVHASILMHMMVDVGALFTFYNMTALSALLPILMLLSIPGYVVYGRRLGRAYKEGRL